MVSSEDHPPLLSCFLKFPTWEANYCYWLLVHLCSILHIYVWFYFFHTTGSMILQLAFRTEHCILQLTSQPVLLLNWGRVLIYMHESEFIQQVFCWWVFTLFAKMQLITLSIRHFPWFSSKFIKKIWRLEVLWAGSGTQTPGISGMFPARSDCPPGELSLSFESGLIGHFLP